VRAPGTAVVRHVVTFGRVLREGGVEVGPGRVAEALRGLAAVDLSRHEDVYYTLRQTLISRQDDLELFDRAFTTWFLREPLAPGDEAPGEPPVEHAAFPSDGAEVPGSGDAETQLETGASEEELFRRKDFAEMTNDELEQAARAIETIAGARPLRRSRRRAPDRQGDRLALRQLVRRSLRTGGDPVERPRLARKIKPRKLLVLCDVSGSMSAYARALLLFLHAAVETGAGVEAFAFGTRLTRLTHDLRVEDPQMALARVTSQQLDWGSGTRIGASLRELNETFGGRGLARGAVVVVVSDGWERDDPALLAKEMAQLARTSYAVVWVNPLKGRPTYRPLAGGMRAALPYVDRFLPGNNLESLEELAAVLAGIERRHAA
jgi:uncharacterized protein